jgi:hypothetical protein
LESALTCSLPAYQNFCLAILDIYYETNNTLLVSYKGFINNSKPNGKSRLVTDFSRLFKQGFTKQAFRDDPKPTDISILMRNWADNDIILFSGLKVKAELSRSSAQTKLMPPLKGGLNRTLAGIKEIFGDHAYGFRQFAGQPPDR